MMNPGHLENIHCFLHSLQKTTELEGVDPYVLLKAVVKTVKIQVQATQFTFMSANIRSENHRMTQAVSETN